MHKDYKYDEKRTELMREIQKLGFAAVDLNLYLDNFPENQQVLCCYNEITDKLLCLKKNYEKQYGALSNFGNSNSQYPWTWVNEPWPWEAGE